jgi:hypothetical protein
MKTFVSKTITTFATAAVLFSTLVANGSPNGMTVAGALGEMSATASAGATTLKSVQSTDYLGAKVGYAGVKPNAFGFLARATLANKLTGDKWGNYTILRPEINAAFGVNEALYFFGGVNIQKFLQDDFSKLGLGTGLQIGAGYQLNETLFVEGQYLSTTHTYESVEFTFNSLEVSLGTTF